MSRTKYPPPFMPLNRSQRKYYDRIWSFVSENIGLEDVDNFVITLAAQHLNMAAEALKRIDKDANGKPLQTFENGTRQVSPDYTIYKSMSDQAMKMLEKSGVLPKARKDLGLLDEEAPQKEDTVAALLGMNKKNDRKVVN